MTKKRKPERKNQTIRGRIEISDPSTGGFETKKEDFFKALADINDSYLGPKFDLELELVPRRRK